jgi:hypothetical protein
MTPENDTEYLVEIISEVQDPYEYEGKTYVSVSFEGGAGIALQLDNGGAPPKEGDIVRLYGKGLGYSVRGASIEEAGKVVRVLYYRTPEEEEKKRQAWVKAESQRKRDDYFNNIADYRERIGKLPAEFQDRLNRFEDYGGEEWMVNNLGYELFVCEQAVLIANSEVADFKAFYDLPWDEQVAAVPGLDGGHSGNTFGASVRLANVYRQKPQFIPFEHAAIHGLIGCEAAGCYAARHEKTGEQLPAA